jgi:hypothetical protein
MRKGSFLYIYSNIPRYTKILPFKNPGSYPSEVTLDRVPTQSPFRYVSGYLMPNTEFITRMLQAVPQSLLCQCLLSSIGIPEITRGGPGVGPSCPIISTSPWASALVLVIRGFGWRLFGTSPLSRHCSGRPIHGARHFVECHS